MLRRCLFLVLTCVLWGSFETSVLAQESKTGQDRAFVLQRFRPSFDQDGLHNAYGAESLGQFRYFFGLWGNVASRPFIIVGGTQEQDIVSWQAGVDLGGGIGFIDRKWVGLDLLVNIPMSVFVDGRVPDALTNGCGTGGRPACPALPAFAMSDMSLSLKYRLLGERWQGVGLAFIATLLLPTGNDQAFHGEGQASVLLTAAISKQLSVLKLVANLGFQQRPRHSFLGVPVASEFVYRAGGVLTISQNYADLVAEVSGGVAIDNPTLANAPLEVLGSLRFYPTGDRNLAVSIGGGGGIIEGFGIPTFRVFLGVVYTSSKPGPADRDGDGVYDDQDRCPDKPGSKSNQGCPADRDDDGVPDFKDRCPDRTGPVANKGCPYTDTDNDGVIDREDNCVNKPGPVDNNGCPWKDTDGDGLKDDVDKCPKQRGPKSNHGCPDKDRDKDTVVDRMDNCPDIPGPVANKGCPKKLLIKVDRTTNKILLLEKIYFATARSKIRRRSYPVLSQVHAVMTSNPKIKIRIEGHTDSRGGRRYNRRLSQRRANAVKRHLVKKGIAANRLTARGFGPDRPIASNRTRKGRSKNRRVEFHIVKNDKD